MPSLSYDGALRRVLLRGVRDESKVHYESVGRQPTPTLCGFEGGMPAGEERDRPVDCSECLAIVHYFGPTPASSQT